MATKAKNRTEDLNIVDAVETLSSIAELGADKKMGILEEKQIQIKDKQISYHSVRWLHNSDGETTLAVIREIFRVILDYLIAFYENQYNTVKDKHTAEEIRTIMVLVGEAAKNLDKYGNLFHQSHHPISVTELQEYKELQAYYLTKVAPKIDDGHMGKWILALSSGPLSAKPHLKLKHQINDSTTKHVFVDLHSVKRDSEYELFFIRKEDGTRFFNPRLIRNLKLVCDLGNFFRRAERKQHVLPKMDIWLDKYIQASAASMVSALKSKLDLFFREAMRQKGKPLVEELTKTSMALLLSASPSHLMSEHPSKSCLSYFKDFQRFLREILHSKEYQKLAGGVGASNKLGALIRDTVLSICRALFLHAKGMSVLQSMTNDILHKGKKKTGEAGRFSEFIQVYEELQELIQTQAHGPLNKMLDVLLDGENDEFDPMALLNLPSPLYAAYFNDKRLLYIRMPSPTHQEYVHKAFVTEEFKNYLASSETGHGVKKHLLVVLQDKTTWKEAARCHAIEGLLHHKDFANHLEVCTLSYGSDLYHQAGEYLNENDAESFKKILHEHLIDNHSGFFFSAHLQRPLHDEFLPHLLDAVHRVFFDNAKQLTRDDRQAFIDLAYVFITLKVVEVSHADALSFCCKDGIDAGAAFSGLLFALFQWVSTNYKDAKGDAFLNYLLYTPALLWRERALQPEPFYRLINTLKVIENVISKKDHVHLQQQLRQQMSDLFTLPLWNVEVNWS